MTAKKKKGRSATPRTKSASAKTKQAGKKPTKAKARSSTGEEAHYSDLRRLGGSFASRKLS